MLRTPLRHLRTSKESPENTSLSELALDVQPERAWRHSAKRGGNILT